MDENELKIKIYERLGLKIGSLASESGNDWVRAEKEILAEYRQEQFALASNNDKLNYSTIDKNSDDFNLILKTDIVRLDHKKLEILERSDLTDLDINYLIQTGSKDVLIKIARERELSNEQLDMIIPKSVYLVKKYLIKKQTLSTTQKAIMLDLMKPFKNTYASLIDILKQL